jgi:hypothetical protein
MSRRPLVLVSIALLASCAGTSPAPQEVDWFTSGFFVGGEFGQASSSSSAAEIDADLDARGHTTGGPSSFEGSDSAWHAFGGFRFESPFSIQVGYSHLGQVESQIGRVPATGQEAAFNADVAAAHPFLGQGLDLSGRWYFWEHERIQLALLGGVWFWEADVEVSPGTGSIVNVSDSGVDPIVGIEALFRVHEIADVTLAWDRYYLDDNEGDVIWLGVQFDLGERLGAGKN